MTNVISMGIDDSPADVFPELPEVLELVVVGWILSVPVMESMPT